jgi:hypothetical protein
VAASIVLADPFEHQRPGKTWNYLVSEDSNLTKPQFLKIARKQRNFLKHAQNDPGGTLNFNPSATDALLTVAVFNASELAPLSREASVFQLCAIALLSPEEMINDPPSARQSNTSDGFAIWSDRS